MSNNLTRQVIQALFHQLTNGCNCFHCRTSSCKSSPEFVYKDLNDPNLIAKQAVGMATDYQKHMCPGIPPAFLKPELYSVSDEFKELIVKLLNEKEIQNIEKMSPEKILTKAFSSPEQLEYLAMTNNGVLTKENLGIDDDFIVEISDCMYRHSNLFLTYKSLFTKTFNEFFKNEISTYHQLRFLLILPAFRFYFDEETGNVSNLYEILINTVMDTFKPEIRSLYFDNLAKYPKSCKELISICQNNLTLYLLIISADHFPLRDSLVDKTVQFLRQLKQSLVKMDTDIDDFEFYNDPYSEQYIAQVKKTHIIQADHLFQSEIIINLETKFELMSMLVSANQQNIARRELLNLFLGRGGGMNEGLDQVYLNVEVRRDHLLEDAVQKISTVPKEDLKKHLQVKFKGEDAIDAGGVSREFFYLITDQLFSPDHGMFRLVDKKYYWFLQGSIEEPIVYNLLGTIIGLAINNKVTLPIRFPIVFYKKLLEIPVTFDDLKEVEESAHQSMMSLRELKKQGMDISESCLTFTATFNQYGKVVEQELVPGGANKDVNNDNLEEYISAYVQWALNSSIEKFFGSFKRGFEKVVERDLLKLFTAKELQVIVSGEENFDWSALKLGTQYIDGYDENSRAVKWFWEIFENLSEEQKINFLTFSTGTDKAPVGGLAQTHLVIQRSGDAKKLPVAHTCFNIFQLPDYPTKEIMEKSILIALDHIEGFGLK